MPRYFIDRVSRHIVFTFGMAAFLILVFIAIFILKESLPALGEVGIVELLVGIPSVVYGLVGMIVLCPLIANLSGTGSGSSVLAAAIVLAVMVLPTITSISEDSIRAVPPQYKEGALALGATHWQTIHHILLPAARRGIITAIILGTGRAIGETMAMVMVIGNSPIFPTNIFAPARTLTGNIAVEIAAATGIHESALFTTGLVLFILVVLINSVGLLAFRRRAG
jgi:phosphate transport system permease protein